jgi:hypothetical protein
MIIIMSFDNMKLHSSKSHDYKISEENNATMLFKLCNVDFECNNLYIGDTSHIIMTNDELDAMIQNILLFVKQHIPTITYQNILKFAKRLLLEVTSKFNKKIRLTINSDNIYQYKYKIKKYLNIANVNITFKCVIDKHELFPIVKSIEVNDYILPIIKSIGMIHSKYGK